MTETKWPFSYIYSSFNFDSLKKIHTFDSKAEVNYLTKNLLTLKIIIKAAQQILFQEFIPEEPTPSSTHFFSKVQKDPSSWTVNQETEIRQAFKQHVGGSSPIFRNVPSKFVEKSKTSQNRLVFFSSITNEYLFHNILR